MVLQSIGVDIGGTKIALGLIDSSGNIVQYKRYSTDACLGPDAITDRVADEIRVILQKSKSQINGVGVGVAGQVDSVKGIVHFAPNLRWKEFPLAQKLNDRLGVPVVVINDVRAAAWGEWRFGAGVGEKDLVCLFVGTGIGGSIISGGKMMLGATNCAGELGHMIVDFKGPKCTCGNFGCLEAFSSGWAIGQKAQEYVVNGVGAGKLLVDLAGGDCAAITAKIVSEAAGQKDPLALQVLDAAIGALGAGVISLVHAFNPSCIVLGGGVIEGNPFIVEKIRMIVREKALVSAVKGLRIEKSILKDNAAIIGAVFCVNQLFKE